MLSHMTVEKAEETSSSFNSEIVQLQSVWNSLMAINLSLTVFVIENSLLKC